MCLDETAGSCLWEMAEMSSASSTETPFRLCINISVVEALTK